ncbi:glycosyltransferase [Herbiconiux sp. L3-i23]|uniref:glycosyltransferase n=1 Tax=Herbiconiux sp. L3-i23 TaxID=2905871 RepID=UPI00205E3C25|nr:glycosyltransferase [Herbiconiux sp. L3-i23]BDI22572.1 oleandomycin glycosyltransferase [Herbiconiux sp. L3-i23]
MAHILFLTLDGGGNVAPVIPIAHELLRRGHAVRFLAAPTQIETLAADDLDAAPYRRARGWYPRTTSGAKGALAFARLLSDPGYADDLADELAGTPADVVVMDALIPASISRAVRGRVPVVVLMHTLAEFFLRNRAVTALTSLQGVRARDAWASANSVLVTSDRLLDPASRREFPPNFIWTGPAERQPWDSSETSTPLPRLLVSLSTVAAPGQAAVLQRILDAVAHLPITVLATTGPAIDATRLRAGVNTELVASASHATVLPTVSAVIGHGGHSTTMRSLMNGKPMVIIPCDTRIDQPLVGRAVERAGAGIVLRKHAAPSMIAEAVTTLLKRPDYRRSAEAIRSRLRAAHGVDAACHAILHAAGHQDVPRAPL